MPVKRFILALLGGVGLFLLFFVPSAQAETCEPYSNSCGTPITPSNTKPAAGEAVKVNTAPGTFKGGDQVAWNFNGLSVGASVAAADGSTSFTFAIPPGTAPGCYNLVGSDASGHQISSLICVPDPHTSNTSHRRLPFTGNRDGLGSQVAIAFGLLTAGASALLLGRRHRRTHFPISD